MATQKLSHVDSALSPSGDQTQAPESQSAQSGIQCPHAAGSIDLTDRSSPQSQRDETASEPDSLTSCQSDFRELIEALPILIWTCRADGVCDYLSPQWLRYTGLAGDNFSLDCLLESIHPEDRERAAAAWQLAVQRGDSYDAEFRLQRRDGVYRWFNSRATPMRNSSGQILKWFGTCFDIEEQKRLEDSLRERDRRLREIFENLIVGCQILDHELRYVYINLNAAQHGRMDRQQLLGKRMVDVYPGIEQTDIYARILHCLQTGVSERLDNIFHFQDGSVGIFELSIQPVPEGVLIVSADVTQERQLADRLLQSQKLEAVGRLAGGVAHDFNNLLTVIQGHCDMLELAKDVPAHRESIAAIRAAGARAARLTRQLLSFSRHAFVHAEVLDINEMLANSVDFIGSLLGEAIELKMELAQDLGPVCIDPGQFEQVVLNLVLNARDAMPKGGTLNIVTRNLCVPSAFDNANCNDPLNVPPGRYVALLVHDDGIGIPPEIRDRIFEPFFTTKDIGRGTGLGLPVVHGAVTQANGHITVHSEVGVGSSFQILYPCHQQSTSEPVLNHGVNVSPSPQRILLVEDEDSVRKIVRISLEKQGCLITECNGPEYALAAVQHQPPFDLLVTDVVMPNMRGPELANTLRRDMPALRVLYMSGYADDSIGLKTALRPGDDFLQKPFSPAELARRVRQLLSSGS